MRIELSEPTVRSIFNLKGKITTENTKNIAFSYDFEEWLKEFDIDPNHVTVSCLRTYHCSRDTSYVPYEYFQNNSVIPTRDIKSGEVNYVWSEDKWTIDLPTSMENVIVFVMRWV